ncbi:zinc-finger homeodomain protein 11-like [Castanea sativa]|uniref:zinc-finger homeodomain protein 11-like n=1 Tax=Castanea sativa TaxID=21020 RepID=UPI003F64BC39
MDFNPTTPTSPTPDTDAETPPQTQPFKSLSFTNGSLKRHHPLPLPPPTQPQPKPKPQQEPPMLVFYKECLKNHAATMGGLALDGCGEFLPSPNATPSDPTSLKCAACGCHRNFHRRDTDTVPKVFNFHHQLKLSSPRSSPSTSPSPVRSPPPVSHLPPSQYYYSSASSLPQMLLSLSAAAEPSSENPLGKKRFRSKFTQEQKEKMFEFSEKLGWTMQKCNDGLVEEFCNEVGIDRKVLRVWMHNNKSTLRKKEMGLLGHHSTVSDGTAAFCCKKEIDYSVNVHVSANGSSPSS